MQKVVYKSHLCGLILGCLASLLCVSTVGANASEQNATRDICDELRIGFHGPVDLKEMDIYTYTFDGVRQIAEEIFDPLVYVVADGGRVVGMAAESWSYEDQGYTLRVKLRKAHWSDGRPVVADDFVAGFKVTIQGNHYSEATRWDNFLGAKQWREGHAKAFPGVSSEGPSDLIFRFVKPYQFDVRNISMIFPVPSHLPIKKNKQWGQQASFVSNGAYYVSSNDKGRVVLEKNPHYWNSEPEGFERIVYTADSMDESLKRYMQDEIDVVLDVPFKQLDWVNQYLQKQVVHTQQSTLIYIALDTRLDDLKHAKIRRALMLATQKNSMLQAALGSVGTPVVGLLPPIAGSPPVQIPALRLNQTERLALAKSLMAEMGYGLEKPLKLTFGYYDIEPFKNVALAAMQQWKDIGVVVELQGYSNDFGDLLKAFNEQKFGATVFTWSPKHQEEFRYMSAFIHKSAFNGFFHSDILKNDLSGAFSSVQTPAYMQKIRGLEAELFKVTPVVPIGWWKNKLLKKSHVLGVKESAEINRLYSRFWKKSKKHCQAH